MDLMVMERVGDGWGKNRRILFDRPKPTVGCSASGRRSRRRFVKTTIFLDCLTPMMKALRSFETSAND
jgi:hypothetical protein